MAMLGLIGGVISAFGAIQAGQAQKASADYQAAVARNNKIIAEQSAVYDLQSGQVEEQASRMKYGEAIGEAKAAQSASGIETETGSAPKARQTIQLMEELDAATIADRAGLSAYYKRVQGTNFEAEARLREFEGKQAVTASYFSAAGSLIGGLSSMMGSGGGGSMFGGSGSVAPKWNEMASTGPSYEPFKSTYGPYSSGPYPTVRPSYYSGGTRLPTVAGFPG